MPGVTLHFVLAERLVERWVAGGSAPFEPEDPDQLNAFFHGSVGPDLGYFPGGSRLLSELAHCVRTGGLTRELIRSARTPTERAFAWGWLAHVVADRDIHPLIGRAVGALTHGSTDVFVDGASDMLSHLRIELGLDCWYAFRHPSARSIRLRPLFDETSISFLQGAYGRVYEARWPTDPFLSSHRAVVRRANQLLATIGWVRRLMHEAAGARRPSAPGWVLRAAWSRSRLRCACLAYLNPVAPTPWLLDRVAETIPSTLDRCASLHATGGVGLGDDNLDTGRPIEADPGHGGVVRATRALAALVDARGGGRVATRVDGRVATRGDRSGAAWACGAIPGRAVRFPGG